MKTKLKSGSSCFGFKALKPNAVNPGSTWDGGRAKACCLRINTEASLSGVNLGSTWGQPGVDLGSTWDQPGVDLGSTWGQPGVDVGSTLDQPGVKLGSTWG